MDTGTRLGPYEIIAKIGEGGMGAVYKARDTRLERTVAIKRSAEAFNERFEREAQAIAALNHPHICTLFDVGHDYLVMELVDGKPLAGPLPVDEAVRYAIQIASALDAAHRRGITHRDLKPANILVTKAGVKLLDFGLAKLTRPAVDRDATQVLGATQPGMIMGTPQYMSPEQVEAAEADARSDIFSFGAILYELITGRKAFEGKTAASVMAAVLREQPPSTTVLVPVTPAALERIVKRCLEKDPDDRFQSARDVMHALQDLPLVKPGAAAAVVAAPSARWKLPAAVCAGILLGAIGFGYLYRTPSATTVPYHLAITPPYGMEFGEMGNAISPDGRLFAFASEKGIWLRPLDGNSAAPVAGTEGATHPFWSADSKSIGYGVGNKVMRVEIASAARREITALGAGTFRGASWNEAGDLIFSSAGLHIQPANGGASRPLRAPPDRITNSESANYWPHFLPGGDRFLYTIRSSEASHAGIYIGSIKDPSLKVRIVDAVSNASFVPASFGHPGYLLFVRDGILVAQPFDPDQLSVNGEPAQLAQAGIIPSNVNSNFSVSRKGTIIVGRKGQGRMQMTWLDRHGNELSHVGPIDAFIGVFLAPDGSRVALRKPTIGGSTGLWLYDFARGVLGPLAPTGIAAAWAVDSQEILYLEGNLGALWKKRYDSTGPGVEMAKLPSGLVGGSHLDWSSDRQFAVVKEIIRLGGGKLDSNLPNEWGQGSFSPDGKWISSIANGEIVVQSFPDLASRWQVSTKGGSSPIWRRDGKELFYLAHGGQLMAVTVRAAGRGLAFDPPVALFSFKVGLGFSDRYQVSADGQKFLVLKTPNGERDGLEMTVLLNWREGLKK